MYGQRPASWSAQGVASPPKPALASTRCLKSAIQATTAGSVRSSARTATSTSPETPVASWSWSTFCSSGQVAGHELAQVGDHLGPGADGEAGDRDHEPDREHPAGGRDRGCERAPADRPDPLRDASARDRLVAAQRTSVPARTARPPTRRAPAAAAGAAPPGERERREPGGQRDREREQRSRPPAGGRSRGPSGSARAAGRGSRRRSRAAAVAITGPPRAAASTAARGGEEPSARASLKRAWNWIA